MSVNDGEWHAIFDAFLAPIPQYVMDAERAWRQPPADAALLTPCTTLAGPSKNSAQFPMPPPTPPTPAEKPQEDTPTASVGGTFVLSAESFAGLNSAGLNSAGLNAALIPRQDSGSAGLLTPRSFASSSLGPSPSAAPPALTLAGGAVPAPLSVLEAELQAKPKAARSRYVKHRQMRTFVTDPRLLALLRRQDPVCVTCPGGLSARDLIESVMQDLRLAHAAALQEARTFLEPEGFEVVAADPDGTPDEDIRIAWADARTVDHDCVLITPRRGTSDRAVTAHRRWTVPPASSNGVGFTVLVRHEGADGSCRPRTTSVEVLPDIAVGSLADVLGRKLFLKTGPAQCALERESLCIHYNTAVVCVADDAFFRFEPGPPWTVPVAQLTVHALHQAGVTQLSLSSDAPFPEFLCEDGSASDTGGGPTATSTGSGSFGGVPADVKVAHMDDHEAMKFHTFAVRKRNERKVWQHRRFAVDKDFIYNQRTESERAAGTKRPLRRIVDIEEIRVSMLEPKRCDVEYRPNGANDVTRDELEFASAAECKHFATKLRILRKMALDRPVTATPTPGPERKSSLSNMFSRLFK